MSLSDELIKLHSDVWTLQNLAFIGKEYSFNDVADAGSLAHLFLVMQERLEKLEGAIDSLAHSGLLETYIGKVEGGVQ